MGERLCCDKAARGIVCDHLRDALLAGIKRMRMQGISGEEAAKRRAEVLTRVVKESPNDA